MENIEKLKYPIGKFDCPEEITTSHVNNWIQILEELPSRLEKIDENGKMVY